MRARRMKETKNRNIGAEWAQLPKTQGNVRCVTANSDWEELCKTPLVLTPRS